MNIKVEELSKMRGIEDRQTDKQTETYRQTQKNRQTERQRETNHNRQRGGQCMEENNVKNMGTTD